MKMEKSNLIAVACAAVLAFGTTISDDAFAKGKKGKGKGKSSSSASSVSSDSGGSCPFGDCFRGDDDPVNVPEPGTLALLCAGMAGFAAARRFRNKK